MDNGDKSSGGVPGGGLIAVALLALGALFVSQAPYRSNRPVQAEPFLAHQESPQDIDARLWQDPFGAIAKAREQMLKTAEGKARDLAHQDPALFDALSATPLRGNHVVLAVMLFGGPHAEQVESRRRMRYAVLAALSTRRFVPSDNAHLGYLLAAQDPTAIEGLPEVIPFERFTAEASASPRDRDCRQCGLTVLWLDGAAFQANPLAKLSDLARRLRPPADDTPGAPPMPRWRVLGPAGSDGLSAIVSEASRSNFNGATLKVHDFRFFSPSATAPDASLLPADVAGTMTVSAYLATRGVTLVRAIGSDDRLAQGIMDELALRGLGIVARGNAPAQCPEQGADLRMEKGSAGNPLPSSIAIVTEWDSLYGRAMRGQYRVRQRDMPAGPEGAKSREGPEAKSAMVGFCVTRWHYVRGLDGRLPGDAAPPASDGRAAKEQRPDSLESAARQGGDLERAEGQSQFDYLRRLALRIRAEDEERRHRFGPEGGIRAIGVLGNDVYDKLLVLQALQPEMPHAIFFTTDLDARLFHPREQAWARNLLVASNFGLRLDDRLQRGIPPFRDSYQTAAYLATLLAMGDVAQAFKDPKAPPRYSQRQLDGWFTRPRLFEVSRSGAFDFSSAHFVKADPRDPPCTVWAPEDCLDIHPRGSPMFAPLPYAARFGIAALVTLALWAPALALSRGGKRRLRRFVAADGCGEQRARAHRRRSAMVVIGLVALAVLPALLLAGVWPGLARLITDNGKPLSWSEGISPWPTYAIRCATLVLCLYFVQRAWSALQSNLDEIARAFRLGPTRRLLNKALAAEESQRSTGQRVAAMLSMRFYRERPGPVAAVRAELSPATAEFWKHYIVQNRIRARVLRTVLCMVAMIALAVLVGQAMGDAPISPLRGHLSSRAQTLSIWPAVLAIQFLIFFVVDATLLGVLFMRGLRLRHTSWPQRTLQAFELRTGVPAAHLDDWIDLEFLARRSACVGTLIYYPAIVLSMMLLARSPFFDDWVTPPSLIAVATLSFGLVLACALALRRAAEASRQHALATLSDAILRAKGSGPPTLAGQLEALSARVTSLHKGAFAPYLQQPLLKAVLLPVLTFGGSSMFDYLSMLKL